MKMNRELQHRILEALSHAYPERCALNFLPGHGSKEFEATLIYLYESGLIEGTRLQSHRRPLRLANAKITAGGLDLLQNDGGDDAIRGAVGGAVDPEEIRALLAHMIDEAPLGAEEKEQYHEAIRSASADQLVKLLMRLARIAVDRLPDVLRLIQIGSDVFA